MFILLSFRARIGDSFVGQMHNEVCYGDALLSGLFDANVTILFISIGSLDLVWALSVIVSIMLSLEYVLVCPMYNTLACSIKCQHYLASCGFMVEYIRRGDPSDDIDFIHQVNCLLLFVCCAH